MSFMQFVCHCLLLKLQYTVNNKLIRNLFFAVAFCKGHNHYVLQTIVTQMKQSGLFRASPSILNVSQFYAGFDNLVDKFLRF